MSRVQVRARWRAVAGGVLAVAVVAGVAACADDDGDASSAATTGAAATFVGADAPAGAPGGATATTAASAAPRDGDSASPTTAAGGTATTTGDGSAAGLPSVAVDPATYGRDVVYTATVAIEADDVAAATRRATAAVTTAGGFLFGQHTVTDPGPTTELIFKIPPTGFQGTLDALEGLGRLLDQDVSADDVTGTIVDLQSQITTTEVSVDRLRGFLAGATDVPTIASLENELRSRETDLERMRGQLRAVQDQVALATITLTITRTPVPVPSAVLVLQQSLAKGRGAVCPEPRRGEAHLSVAEGDPATVCYVVTNRGDTALADVEVVDGPLELTTRDLVVVEGDLDQPLAPKAHLVLAGTFVVDGDVRSAPVATAVPVDANGTRLGDAPRATATARLTLDDDHPTFGGALSASARVLVWVGIVLALLVAVALPFAWIPVLAAGLVALGRRRRTNRGSGSGPAAPATPPAPEVEDPEREPVSG